MDCYPFVWFREAQWLVLGELVDPPSYVWYRALIELSPLVPASASYFLVFQLLELLSVKRASFKLCSCVLDLSNYRCQVPCSYVFLSLG